MASLASEDAGKNDGTEELAEKLETSAVVSTGEKKKKKKKKKKKSKAGPGASNADSANSTAKAGETAVAKKGGKTMEETVSSMTAEQKKLLFQAMFGRRSLRGKEAVAAAANKEHKFWDTQPVPKVDEDTSTEEVGRPIHELKTPDDVSPDPLKLPGGFEWVSMDVTKDEEIDEIYDLLFRNYVEDDDNMFRFDYSREFLKWALQPPGYFPEWHVGVRQSNNGKLRALITGIPVGVAVHGNEKKMCEINFLCVHKKLRSKRVAPVLIQEVTRRVNRRDIWQAVYTAGVVLPKPVGQTRYWHRSINPQKLIEVKFSRLQPRMTMNRTIRLYKLPEEALTPGLRPMTMVDVPSARALLKKYLSDTRFKLHIDFESDEEFAHWLLPREGVVSSYVVTDNDGKVTDLCSYYHLNSTIIGNDKYKTLFAAYSFYNVATTTTLTKLMKDLLILSKKTKVDVFNLLDVMDNTEILEELKFGIGDGYLQYYLYNWRCKQVEAPEIGIVLL